METHGESPGDDEKLREYLVLIENHCYLNSIPEAFRNMKEIVMAAVRRNPANIKYASKEWQNNMEVALIVVKQSKTYGHLLEYLSEKLQDNERVVELASKEWVHALSLASERLRGDYVFMEKAILNNFEAFRYASETLKNNKEFAKLAVLHDVRAWDFVSKGLKDDKELFQICLKKRPYWVLRIAGKKLRNDKELVTAAVKECAQCLQLASKELRNDKGLTTLAVMKNGECLKVASEELRNDRDVAEKAIICNVKAARHFGSKLVNDTEFLCSLMRQGHNIYPFLPLFVQCNKEIVGVALERFGVEKIYLDLQPTGLLEDKVFVLSIIKDHPEIYDRLLRIELKEDLDVIVTMLRSHPKKFLELPCRVLTAKKHIEILEAMCPPLEDGTQSWKNRVVAAVKNRDIRIYMVEKRFLRDPIMVYHLLGEDIAKNGEAVSAQDAEVGSQNGKTVSDSPPKGLESYTYLNENGFRRTVVEAKCVGLWLVRNRKGNFFNKLSREIMELLIPNLDNGE